VHLALFADPGTAQGHGLGRRTMPEMAEYSAVMAVHTLWLVARAEGLGLGWVSILDPVAVSRILEVPGDWIFLGYFCLGYPQSETVTPELAREGWEQRRPWEEFVLRREAQDDRASLRIAWRRSTRPGRLSIVIPSRHTVLPFTSTR
jgi:5,6-dimethylbenzimidazole synthase